MDYISEAIKKYYLELKVNPNNKGTVQGAEISQKIENLRELLLDEFRWRNKGYIVFLPNAHYAKLTLFRYILNKNGNENIKIFSNSILANHDLLERNFGLNVKYIDRADELKGVKGPLVYLVSLEEESYQADLNDLLWDDRFKYVPKLGKSYDDWEPGFRKYLIVETFTDDYRYVKDAFAFIFNVMPGISIMGVRKGINMKPVVLGSGSVDYADREGYKLKDDFRVHESGTMNVPFLLGLEEYYKNKIEKRD